MIKFKLTPSHFEHLIKQSYSLDHIYLLKLIEASVDIQPMIDGSMKIAGLYQSLVRKGLVSEVTQEITLLGRELLTFADTEEKKQIVKMKPLVSDFETWWNSFPATDNFEHKGKKFTGSRGLKRSKDDCRIKFNKILAEGEYTAQLITDATLLDVFLKKEASAKNNENRLSYIQNSLTYLIQRSYEPFIEMVQTGMKIPTAQPTSKGSIDI
jgi:hypothetical protein